MAMAIFSFSCLYSQDEARLLRFPAIHGNQLIFSYAGDLYTSDANGGMARRITSSPGYEMFGHFSPDGRYIAFTGQYDGNTEVFVMPSKGGMPVRLTYTATLSRDDIGDRMGPNNIVMAWTPDSKYIIYRSRKESFNSFKGSLFKVSVDGGLSEQLPLSFGGFCSFSPDGRKLAFNPVFREFRTWKYYRGGMADDIHIYDTENGTVEKITDNEVQDIIPMWVGDNIYFLSDRDRTMNLFVYHTGTKATEKLTDFDNYDIKFPTADDSNIVFENGGYIYKYDIAAGKAEKVSITIANDEPQARAELKDVSKDIRSGDVSPNGERVVFAARGEIFSLPAKEGVTYNYTQSAGIHERNVGYSPDGENIAYLSDQSGEFEIWIRKQDGTEPARQLTRNADTYIYSFDWSPDSKKILYHDRKLRLRYIEVESGKITEIETEKFGIPNSYDWSPDSKWIAYEYTEANEFTLIRLFNLDSGKKYDVTDTWYDSGGPCFSDDGKFLFFVSARDFDPIYSRTEWNTAYNDMSKIYLVTLAADTKSPFGPENDMVKPAEIAKDLTPDEKEKKKKSSEKAEVKAAEKTVKIDVDGIKDRIDVLPIEASNYYNIQSTGNKVYYIDYSMSGGSTAKVFDLEKKKEQDLGKNLRYALSANGNKMLVGMQNKWAVINPPDSEVKIEDAIDLSGMKTQVNYRKEWRQIFDESWRQFRDFFYVPNMHGVDWNAMKDKYGQLVPYVRTRDDLTYIIGEMIGELSIGHAYITTGEKKEKPERIKTGLLGAQLSRTSSGYYQIKDILKGANWNKELRSPLTEIGVKVKEGDYILAVNGVATDTMNDIYASLVGKAGLEVELTVNDKPEMTGSHKIVIIPVDDESRLYYYKWVQHNIAYVNEKTGGQVGYIHIPDMGTEGLNEFMKHFYPQLDKKGLIIDDRGNGGGNVSPMIIERLRREVTRSTMRRNFPLGEPVPQEMMLGPKVLLIDKYSASDGDLFAYSFKKHNIGTVIGTRTWGGVVGITGSLPFIDNQDLRKPEFASYSAEKSEWIIEGHGVSPDITLDNDLHQEFLGNDAQLDKAIEVIMEQLKDYKGVPAVPEPPVKNK